MSAATPSKSPVTYHADDNPPGKMPRLWIEHRGDPHRYLIAEFTTLRGDEPKDAQLNRAQICAKALNEAYYKCTMVETAPWQPDMTRAYRSGLAAAAFLAGVIFAASYAFIIWHLQ